MNIIEKKTNRAEKSLPFDFVKRLHDPARFWMHETSESVYIFDRHLSDVVEISDSLRDLVCAETAADFDEVKSKLTDTEIAESRAFLEEMLAMEDLPVHTDRSKTGVSVLKLNVSTACNLSCGYCFRDKSKACPPADPALMHRAIEKMVSDFGRDSQSYTVCFNLASEPLIHMESLGKLHDFVKKLQGKTGKPIELFFITNGTLVSDKTLPQIRKIAKDRLVSVSMDGPKEVHDALRRLPDGSGSYDRVLANLRLLRKKNVALTAEAVITNRFPYPLEIFKHLVDLGFERVNLKPVRKGTPYSFDEKSIDRLKKGYKDFFAFLTDELTAENYSLLTVLAKDYAMKPLWRILFNHKMNVRCGWGINSISMDHKGDFYPCDSVMGVEEYRVGNVEVGIDWPRFHADLDCEKRGTCSLCWARNICGGTCYVNGIHGNGDMLAVDPVECGLTKHLIELNLTLICDLLSGGADMETIKAILKINLTDIYKL